MRKSYDFLIVGAGIAGITMAERISHTLNLSCLIVDKRNHIGGNCYDYYDEDGILVPKYGPHYFRTNSEEIKNYLSQFTEWIPAKYQVLSYIDGEYYPFPINLNTFEKIIGHPSSEEEMKKTLEKWKIPIENPQNSEEMVLSKVGKKLYEMFFKNYTIKQWEMHPRDLNPSVAGRIPIRTNRDDRYVNETFQMMPKGGYTKMFEKMLENKNIQVQLNCNFEEIQEKISYKKLIYTGMIDAFYKYCYGELPYRSLRFEREHYADKEFYQKTCQINYPNERSYTRIVENKHISGQKNAKGTTIFKEYPVEFAKTNEPFYPIPTLENHNLYKKYQKLAESEKEVIFLGRLATYKYFNMDHVFAMALKEFDNLEKKFQ